MTVDAAFNILVLLDIDDATHACVRAAAPDARITVGPKHDVTAQEFQLPAEVLRDVDCLICETPPRNFEDFQRLKWIQLASAGYNQLFGLPIAERGIRVTNARGCFDVPIAEWNVMMLLAWHRNLFGMLENQRQREWDRSAKFQDEFRSGTVGFYGYGGLARETARLLKSMGITVHVLTRDGTIKNRENTYCVPGTGDPDGRLPDRVFSAVEKSAFFAGLDYLIIAVPLTRATTGIIGAAELRMLPRHAVLINPARAAIIEQDALVRCLSEGWIRGASLDVHYAYPLPQEHPLWSLPNTVLTPHIAGAGLNPHFLPRTFDVFTENLGRFRSGQPLLNQLTPSEIAGE